ncbi:MAG TPA: redoxin domain-containing protein [Gemmataceae bacterium]|nr:redoxin domain-containing protein [Gemmataceae bacterium]
MRTWVGVAVATVCLGLAGCSLFGKKQSARTSNPKPFTGSETTAPRETATATVPAAPGGPLPGANGLLAGQVVAAATGRPVKAVIRVKNLDDEDNKAAPLEVDTIDGGYFTIPGLKVGGHYKLIVRAGEGKELASQVLYVQPPKPTLFIQVDKKNTTTSTPPIPDAPKTPDKKSIKGTESSQERSPAASLDPPVRIAPGRELPKESESNPSPNTSIGASQSDGNPPNLSNVADGFRRVPADPSVNIQYRNTSPWPAPPPPPRWEGMQDERPPQPERPPTASPPAVPLTNRPTPVPSCVLIGNKLDNFALKDLNGQTWEYKRNHTGRLTLIDFWYTSCTACLHAIPHLNELQRNYGQYKLEVIGIACETGTVAEQVRNVMSMRGRYQMNYRTLLSGGGPRNCPVINQFGVERYPTLFLLDETGTIIWHSDERGMDDYGWRTLENLIAARLIQRR